jgi:hypothetical protein
MERTGDSGEFQRDASIIVDSTIAQGGSPCGFTTHAGENKIKEGIAALLSEYHQYVPRIRPGGNVTLTMHQVNEDGAGPFKCEFVSHLSVV